MDVASKGSLEDEFGTSNEDEVFKKILKTGELQVQKASPPTPCPRTPTLTVCRTPSARAIPTSPSDSSETTKLPAPRHLCRNDGG